MYGPRLMEQTLLRTPPERAGTIFHTWSGQRYQPGPRPKAPAEPSTKQPSGVTLPTKEVWTLAHLHLWSPTILSPHHRLPPPHFSTNITPSLLPTDGLQPPIGSPHLPLTFATADSPSLYRPNYHITRPNRKVQDWFFKPRRPIRVLGNSNINCIPAHTIQP
ncbi:hypothetical protein JOB18_023234 [Solea senegalensis]|uniref:Uncharacterized protein n=1 Tax=Solea senegalensis TaxID=28829 RepID=A0AAV6Q7H9_SOLSE|nr:hypothetical protein JOB18_023234 [Solea senegalensis]